MAEMQALDLKRLEHTEKTSSSFSSISAYSTIEYPKLLVQPMFEPKTGRSSPNYFQNLFLNREKQPGGFSHGSTRSVFFIGNRLMLLSKFVASHEAEEFFPLFLLAHFEQKEYSLEITPENRVFVSANVQKTAKNLVSGKLEKINLEFNFMQENLQAKLLVKSEVKVPHFAPHPYMMQMFSEFGYESPADLQLAVLDYFRAHKA